MGQPPRVLRRRHIHFLIIGGSALLGLIALFNPSIDAIATRHAAATPSPAAHSAAPPVAVPLALPATETKPTASQQQTQVVRWDDVTVRSGDTLAAIFGRLKFSPNELYAVMAADRNKTATLKQLLPGQALRFGSDGEHRLTAMQYKIDRLTRLEIDRSDNGFSARNIKRPVETRLAYASGTIDSSLFAAGQKAGLSDAVVMQLATIFGWDVDFALDIRHGDSFTVLYEQQYLDGEKLADGNIIAAEFVNQGTTYSAIRFTDPAGNGGYYTPAGLSMRKAFLRSPVDFYRISSRFQRERLNPVLHIRRPHLGVDYAAPTGTPIKAAGDGKIIFRGRKGGYGNVIVIQHTGVYRTLYGHMSRFRGGLSVGSQVRQGQVIGYVGMTGLATGPHLHYEFLVNGVHRNPLTVKLPNASPIAAKYRAAFEAQARTLMARLDTVKRTTLALNTP